MMRPAYLHKCHIYLDDRVTTDDVIIRHLAIEREDGKPIRVGWDTLQAIKDAVLGPHTNAVEFFPPRSQIVNERNRRHFWVFEDLTPPLTPWR